MSNPFRCRTSLKTAQVLSDVEVSGLPLLAQILSDLWLCTQANADHSHEILLESLS